jgi:hypothetical protein
MGLRTDNGAVDAQRSRTIPHECLGGLTRDRPRHLALCHAARTISAIADDCIFAAAMA